MHTTHSRSRVRLSASVMAHPDRSASAHRVLADVGVENARVAFDPEPDGPASSLRSARLAYADADLYPGSTHHLVLQDDVTFSRGFVESARACLSLHPDSAVSFFVEWGSRTAFLARWAVFTGAAAVPVVNPYVPTQALALPRRLAVDLARFLTEDVEHGEADDEAVRRFLRGRGVPALVMVPNLVEHEDLPSLTGNNEHGARHSVCFAPEGAAHDGSVLDPPRLLPMVAWNVGRAVVVDLHDDVPATRRPTLDVLGEWGATESVLRGALDRVVGARAYPVGPDLLFQAWITAVALGALQEGHWPGTVGALRGRLGEPLVARALATLVPGALRVFTDPVALSRRADDLALLVLAAMEYGAAHCRPGL
ncbi:hypothetical protein DFP74_4834 [Nocardiopsis sp. Huas11]|uniref:hypothetical protein n=1 Tax=Nocardiopsis sp. Huas11 TaxID=2183912 RepID=UPI000EAEB6D9|nr:hypothetical protein [Nocardiopsis sp. Huas11]RKS09105.1 hypothetical protein DFP74_4834 [Nocardiopsis sp. Huas11]